MSRSFFVSRASTRTSATLVRLLLDQDVGAFEVVCDRRDGVGEPIELGL